MAGLAGAPTQLFFSRNLNQNMLKMCYSSLKSCTGGDHRWWAFKMQPDANTEMKSRLNCFSTLFKI